MAKADLYNWKKEVVGNVDLDSNVFEVEVKKELLHTVVNWQLALRRQGTHMTKTKGLVSGGGKKPFKQKGTGNARQGSSRSPLMPGGGTMFGPQPRDYSFALPKKVRKLGLKMALSHLHKQGKLFVLDSMVSEGKTKEIASHMKKFGVSKAVLVDNENHLLKRAVQNMASYKYFPAAGLNVFDLLKYDALLLTKSCLNDVVSRCASEKQ